MPTSSAGRVSSSPFGGQRDRSDYCDQTTSHGHTSMTTRCPRCRTLRSAARAPPCKEVAVVCWRGLGFTRGALGTDRIRPDAVPSVYRRPAAGVGLSTSLGRRPGRCCQCHRRYRRRDQSLPRSRRTARKHALGGNVPGSRDNHLPRQRLVPTRGGGAVPRSSTWRTAPTSNLWSVSLHRAPTTSHPRARVRSRRA